ncbi:hypothetical protein SAMN05518683_1353 [Salibacterium halotolerans]|uniref:Uncharacterized protein n=1 Tax=Salibacterium halotolerans TaxID=1884432 RepID=A0A1I5Y3B5_9BACI|nr:hypothetical protein SAMN05518683_1353 [Salibacterium halotolerans]
MDSLYLARENLLSTVNTKVKLLRTFASWLYEESITEGNIAIDTLEVTFSVYERKQPTLM